MSNDSEIDSDVTREWQALTQGVFKEFEPIFEETFVNGTANNELRCKIKCKTTGFIEEIKNGV